MISTLFTIGPFTLHSYGLCMAVGIICAYMLLCKLAKLRGISENDVSNAVMVSVLAGIAGARAFYVAEHWTVQYAADPVSSFKVWEGGLMYYGGLIVGALALVAWCRVKRMPLAVVIDCFAVVLPIGQAFGRIGCFLNGCCYGRVCDSFLAVRYPVNSIPFVEQVNAGLLERGASASLPVLPSQLFETAGCFVISAVLYALARGKNPPKPGRVAAWYFVAYAALRSCIEFARADERMHVGPLTIAQAISAALLLLAGMIFFFTRESNERKENP